MATTTTEALVLRSVDFGESDRIVHLLVPDAGRLTAIAKGARRSVRRFPGTLDLFNHLRVQVERRRTAGMARLEQATLIEAFTPLRRVPARFALGCYLLELLDRLAPEGGARADTRRLFGFALAALRTLATPRRIDARLRTLLELRALDALGLRPELGNCVRCGSSIQAGEARSEAKPSGVQPGGGAREVAFSVADGGPVCARCLRDAEPLLRIHRGTLRALDQGLRFELEQLDRLVMSPQAIEESRRILDRFQRFHTGVELRSERFLDEMLAAGGD
ncbi:MAG TPA: DNA repair protein RecO [Myxococcota bacterium]